MAWTVTFVQDCGRADLIGTYELLEGLEVELTNDGRCVLRAGGVERWRVSLDCGDAAEWGPFREAIVWGGAKKVIAAAGHRLHVLDLSTGACVTSLELATDLIGHLAVAAVTRAGSTVELLFVLGWTDIRCYGADLSLHWHAQHVAVDGITFDAVEGSVVRVHAEMDPPGGWFAVSLDVTTGQELERRPDPLPGYVGMYEHGPPEG